jgi:hypothetical protein
MKLKPQSRSRPAARGSGTRGGRRAVRPGAARAGGRMARRPGVPIRARIGRRPPPLGRVLAFLGAAAGTAAIVALVVGPWLRVAEVDWRGGRYTSDAQLAEALEPQRGRPVLAVDTAAVRSRLEALPSVVRADVTASLAGSVTASIVEPEPAFVWQTQRAALLADASGLVFAALPLDAELSDVLSTVPRVVDERFDARVLTTGDRLPVSLLRTAVALTEVDPAALGSDGNRFSVRIDDDYGFVLVSRRPAWEAAFGIFGLDPRETAAEASARLARQVTAVRTLFATRAENKIGWVDVRNPGKVYFRAKG